MYYIISMSVLRKNRTQRNYEVAHLATKVLVELGIFIRCSFFINDRSVRSVISILFRSFTGDIESCITRRGRSEIENSYRNRQLFSRQFVDGGYISE